MTHAEGPSYSEMFAEPDDVEVLAGQQQYQSHTPPKYIQAHWPTDHEDAEIWRAGFIELRSQVAEQIAMVNELKLQVKGLHTIINNIESKHE